MIKACIFDLDGTILNTITTITHFVNETLQKHGVSPINETECKTFIGDGARKLIERSLGSKGDFTPDFVT
jgi:phosphoglycolate phosphatase